MTALLFSCSSEDPIDPPSPTPVKAKRTIIAYLTGDNNISSDLSTDLSEMTEGSDSLAADCNLIAFVDFKGQKPYIAKLSGGTLQRVRSYEDDFYTTSPDSMLSVYQWIIKNYPADEYATIIGGHGSGSMISKDTIPTGLISLNAYYYDDQGSSTEEQRITYMNTPSMATVFSHLPKMSFIFFDCCSMQTAEVAYELRKAADYIIAPASETHISGAPYKKVVPMLGKEKDIVGDSIITAYVQNGSFGTSCGVCISVIKTDEMENLLNATRDALATLYDGTNPLVLNVDKCIYYFRGFATDDVPILQDMKCVMKKNLSEEAFNKWLPYLEKAIVAKQAPVPDGSKDLWTTSKLPDCPNINFNDFRSNFNEEHYGGISMIFPNKGYDNASWRGYTSMNKLMFNLLWPNKVGWKSFGW